MSVYVEAKIVNSDGDQIGVFKLEMPEQAIAGDNTEGTQIQRFVTNPADGKVYAVGMVATLVGVAAAEAAPVKAPEVSVAEFKVGDRATVTSGASINIGVNLTILEPRDRDGHYWCQLDNGIRRYVTHSHLSPAKAPDVPEFKVGDWVRFTSDDERDKGSLGRIKYGLDSDGDYAVNFGESWNYVAAEDIEPAGDFREGDRVIIVGNGDECHYFKVGSYATVVSESTYEGCVTVEGVSRATGRGLCQTVACDNLEYTLD